MGIKKIFKRKYTQLILCGVALLACQEKMTENKPDDLIPEKKFIAVMADVMVSEAYTAKNTDKFEGISVKVMQEFVYPEINKKYRLSDSAFQHSYRYYMQDAKLYNQITMAIIDTLRERELRLVKQSSEENIGEPDSIQKEIKSDKVKDRKLVK